MCTYVGHELPYTLVTACHAITNGHEFCSITKNNGHVRVTVLPPTYNNSDTALTVM